MFKLVLVSVLVQVALCDVSHLFNHPKPSHHHHHGNEANVQILRQESDIQPDGTYSYLYETENGISAQEQGHHQVISADQVVKTAQGSYSYTSPEGVPVVVSYVADDQGFQPQSDILPTPPPIPLAIQRALDWIASHPQQPSPQVRPGNFF